MIMFVRSRHNRESCDQESHLLHSPDGLSVFVEVFVLREHVGEALIDGRLEQLKDSCRPDDGRQQLQVCLQTAFFYLQQSQIVSSSSLALS